MLRIILITFSLWALYSLIGTAMYTKELASFHGVDWSFKEHGIALNGISGFGSKINVQDLRTIIPVNLNISNQENCPSITSESGYISLSTIDDLYVCCDLASNTQWLVPFKDQDRQRKYLC
jgi:hypothetical protein